MFGNFIFYFFFVGITFVISEKIHQISCNIKDELPLQINHYQPTFSDDIIHDEESKNFYIKVNATNEVIVSKNYIMKDVCHYYLKNFYIFIFGIKLYSINLINEWIYVNDPDLYCVFVKVDKNFIYCYPVDIVFNLIKHLYEIENDEKMIDEEFKILIRSILPF